MKNNLGKFLAVGSLVAGGMFLGINPANAITLVNGDFVTLDIRAKVLSTSGVTQLLNEVLFATTTGPIGPLTAFAPVNTLGVADIGSSFFTNLPGNAITAGTIADIKSLDLDPASGDFALTAPLDLSFPSVTNSFKATGFSNPLFAIDLGGGDALEFSIKDFDVTQQKAHPSVPNTITIAGNGIMKSLIPNNSSSSEVAFATTLNFNPAADGGSYVSAGDLTITVGDAIDVPESSPVSALVGFGLVGSAFALRKKTKLG